MTMTAQTHQDKLDRFRSIRRKLAALSHDWQPGRTPEGNGILARLIPQKDPEPVLTFDHYADRNDITFVTDAPSDMRFLVTLVIELDAELATLRPAAPEPRKPKDYAANCAMSCKDYSFQYFLHVEHGLENFTDSVRVENKVKSMLGIHSKKELNDNPRAAEAWKKLLHDAEAWTRRRARG